MAEKRSTARVSSKYRSKNAINFTKTPPGHITFGMEGPFHGPSPSVRTDF